MAHHFLVSFLVSCPVVPVAFRYFCSVLCYTLIITNIFWDTFTSHGDKPGCIEETAYNLCFGDPLYRRLQKLVGNDKCYTRGGIWGEAFCEAAEEPESNGLPHREGSVLWKRFVLSWLFQTGGARRGKAHDPADE